MPPMSGTSVPSAAGRVKLSGNGSAALPIDDKAGAEVLKGKETMSEVKQTASIKQSGVRRRSPSTSSFASPRQSSPSRDDGGWQQDLLTVAALFLGSVVGLVCLLRFYVFGNLSEEEHKLLSIPTNLEKVQLLGQFLEEYSSKHPLEVLIGHAACYLFLQTFAIPGTVFFNLLGGALYGTMKGYPLCLAYNTVGSLMLYMLSKLFGHRLVNHFMWDRMEMLRGRLQSHRHDLVWYMTSMRIFPFTPNWFMNVSAPHLHVPVKEFCLAIMMGLTPYNFLSCKAGGVLGELRSKSEIIDTSTTVSLAVIAVLSLVLPRLLKGRIAVSDGENTPLTRHGKET